MKIGIPQGLLYTKYRSFATAFLEEIGVEVVFSPDTNKEILDVGVRYCVDEACLPVKIFHGHVAWLRDRCDAILIPRIISVREKEFICPMFCGLIEMVSHNIPRLPPLIDTPIYAVQSKNLSQWAKKTAGLITGEKRETKSALKVASRRYEEEKTGFDDQGYPIRIGLIGHAYNLYDSFLNMDLKNKLNRLGIGVFTVEFLDQDMMEAEVAKLFKQPFWTSAREDYGAAVSIAKNRQADGLIFLSAFSCGIDSVVTELIRNEIGDFPFMVLKLDEHTGEAGFDTRVDAFADLLKRRCKVGYRLS